MLFINGAMFYLLLTLKFRCMTARYRLVSPSEPYAPTFTSAQVKLDLALRTARVLVDDPMAPVATVQERILSGNTAGTSSVPLKQEVLEAEAGFLALQLQALQQVSLGNEVGLPCQRNDFAYTTSSCRCTGTVF